MNAKSSHEPRGINVGRIGLLAGITVGAFLLALVLSLVLWILWHRSTQDAAAPVAQHVLDARAPIKLETLRAQQQQTLNSYGWIDRDAGIARIPLPRAMALLVSRSSAEQSTAQEAEK